MNRGRNVSSGNNRARSRSRSTVRNGGGGGGGGSKNSSVMRTHDEHGNMIDDEAINTFTTALESLPKDEWRARTLAFESLIQTLPVPGGPPAFIGSGIIPWFKSYTALRRLANPVSSLLLNARSSVVKHTCQHFAFLVQSVRDSNHPVQQDTCKYLLKDLLPTILALHAQTVNVIRGYVLEMMTIIFPLCRFKSGLPILLERMRKDKSRDVREACARYLKLIIKHWSTDKEAKEGSSTEQEYLTTNICMHIGNGLARALTDQGQNVRAEAKSAFELYRQRYPDLWDKIVHKQDGILSKDTRLKKSIMAAAAKAEANGITDDSTDYYPASYDDNEDYDVQTLQSASSRGSMNSWNSSSSFMSKSSRPGGYRASVRSSSTTRGLRCPPMRTSNGNLPPASKRPNGYQRSVSNGRRIPNTTPKSPTPRAQSQSAHETENTPPPPPFPEAVDLKIKGSSPISTLASTTSTTVGDNSSSSLNKKPSENYLISNQLLAAHKNYIDQLMESLRTEMNTIRDFESTLVHSQNNPDSAGMYGPTEDEVLKYYENVYAYLDKGAENSMKLRNEMERISKTDFQS